MMETTKNVIAAIFMLSLLMLGLVIFVQVMSWSLFGDALVEGEIFRRITGGLLAIVVATVCVARLLKWIEE